MHCLLERRLGEFQGLLHSNNTIYQIIILEKMILKTMKWRITTGIKNTNYHSNEVLSDTNLNQLSQHNRISSNFRKVSPCYNCFQIFAYSRSHKKCPSWSWRKLHLTLNLSETDRRMDKRTDICNNRVAATNNYRVASLLKTQYS